MRLRCLFGFHKLTSIAELHTQCVYCGKAFWTDYFLSVERGRTTRFPISAEAARRAAGKRYMEIRHG